MSNYIFDENDLYYRDPGTAIETPGDIKLKIRIRHGVAKDVRVCLYTDNAVICDVRMDYLLSVGDYDEYFVKLNIDRAGLYWYHFIIETTSDGAEYVPSAPGGAFQLTAYSPPENIPQWLLGGVIYHVFVDRFCGDGQIRLGYGAHYRADWGGCPYFLPDEDGIVHNSDFFGGNLFGVIEKLPYLQELGVTCIYLSPVFEAVSNHKYDIGDFMKVDCAFGGDEALEMLCKKAQAIGMSVILDGVFNHVGSDSLYFNRYGRYDTVGAYQSVDSPYRDWFTFNDDGTYEAWWGIELLPALNKQNSDYIDYICGDGGVITHWMKKGIAGWRLDVVDELPDSILDPLCRAVKAEKSDALIVGEVWEDASNKIAYDVRRRYFQGGQLDSVMNYPLMNAIIQFSRGGNAAVLSSAVMTICRNYPKHIIDSLMNILGTHDTMRILTSLGGSDFPTGKIAMSHYRLSDRERELGKSRLRIASALQFTLPGVPCIYYGDEAGLEGGADPFNRVCYPWGYEDIDLIGWYKKLSHIRHTFSCFKDGDFTLIEARNGLFAFIRSCSNTGDRVLIAVNSSDEERTLHTNERVINVPNNRTFNLSDFRFDILNDTKMDFDTGSLAIKPCDLGIYR